MVVQMHAHIKKTFARLKKKKNDVNHHKGTDIHDTSLSDSDPTEVVVGIGSLR